MACRAAFVASVRLSTLSVNTITTLVLANPSSQDSGSKEEGERQEMREGKGWEQGKRELGKGES